MRDQAFTYGSVQGPMGIVQFQSFAKQIQADLPYVANLLKSGSAAQTYTEECSADISVATSYL